jgi:hypothetical protein
MKTYKLEARTPDGDWVRIGSGEFDDFSEATKALDDIDWPRNDLRIKPLDEMDMDKVASCECGGKCLAREKLAICDTCGKTL